MTDAVQIMARAIDPVAFDGIPDVLQQCIDQFWADNDELKRAILRDLYANGRVCLETTAMGCRAVDIWLSAARHQDKGAGE
jgi:hypothetical protein